MYKFAIIGCGRIAARHAENIERYGKLAAVCDVVKEKADAMAAQYGAKAYYSIDDLLAVEKDLDVITVCTPNGLHAEHSIKSLQHGKNVLCEKPLCITTVAAWQMADTAYFNRKKLFVVKQNRYNAPVQAVKKALDNRELGNIYSFQINCFWNRPQAYYTGDWKGDQHLDGGIIYTQFSHFIDLLYWFLGDVETVKGFKDNYLKRQYQQLEDTGVFAIKMKNGAIGTLHYTINTFPDNKEGSFTLLGTEGTVKIGGTYLDQLEWFDVKGKNMPAVEPTVYINNLEPVYKNLIEGLNGSGNIIEAKEAAKTIEIIEKIKAATEQVEA